MGLFGKAFNNFYYGKSGKGDYTASDLPRTRWAQFWEMLKIRFSGLMRLNLMYMVCWLPAMIVMMINFLGLVSGMSEILDGGELAQTYTMAELVQSMIMSTVAFLIPCIAITGPFTAGVAYVCRNWARDEHAFIWSDFKDAVKANWKQGLLTSCITSVMPAAVYFGWVFYGSYTSSNPIMIVPQILVMMIGIIWALVVSYMYPLMVTYNLKYKDLLRNAFLLAVGRLPTSLAMRLLHCVPMLIGFLCATFLSTQWSVLGVFLYYCLFGFSLSRFVTAAFTNAAFDKVINPNIEGAEVNRGLNMEEDDDADDDEEEEELPPQA